jgi:predicted dehydrogenase
MIHDLDLVLDLVGSEVESLDAAGGSILSESEDLASVRLVFANGARANVTASRASLKPMRRFRMFGADGYVSLDFTENYGLIVKKGPNWEAGRSELATTDPSSLAGRLDLLTRGILEAAELRLDDAQRPLQAELDAFLRCVREGAEPVVGGEAGRRALALAERVTERIRAQAW